MEDEVEYYSIYDQPYFELQSIQPNLEKDSRMVQEEARPKQRCQDGISDDQHVQMVNKSVLEDQVARTSFDVPILNPDAPVFEPQYVEGDGKCETGSTANRGNSTASRANRATSGSSSVAARAKSTAARGSSTMDGSGGTANGDKEA
ncbi:hypothetical protein Q8A67_012133 [Cirrhinus molitorella]|uniref:Uncharacterized protein n=1 Tax=Cirrhinus molitorella TaxID=172907 RepID=A0AA88TMI1_9TELE|nr:hypothetical protein Q8A67_012133 [Cirrhinus molitorella]